MPLQVDNLALRFGTRSVLANVNFCIEDGCFVGLIGANGSGKSTLMAILAGLLKASEGDVKLDQQPIDVGMTSVRRHIGFALDPSLLPAGLTGRQAIALSEKVLGLNTQPNEALLELRQAVRLEGLLDQQIGRYSLGTQQKLAIVLALLGSPKLLLLDESLNGLDPRSAFKVKQFLADYVRRAGAIVLLATHAIGAVERFCDELLIVSEHLSVTHLARVELSALRERAPSIEDALIARISGH